MVITALTILAICLIVCLIFLALKLNSTKEQSNLLKKELITFRSEKSDLLQLEEEKRQIQQKNKKLLLP